ncbi:MAG: hypothetical protein AB8B61_09190, partial [Cyclobacteriaceae bacterium]
MLTMLNYLNISGHYALVKTANLGNQSVLPSLYFDHVIVAYEKGEGSFHYLDLTTNHYDYNVLPSVDVSQPVLIAKGKDTKYFRLPNDHLSSKKSYTEHRIEAQLDEERGIKINSTSSYKGTRAGYLREVISATPLKERRNYVGTHLAFQDKLLLSSVKFIGTSGVSGVLKATYGLHAHHYTNKIFNYRIFKLPYIQKSSFSTVFKEDERVNVLDLQKVTEITPERNILQLTSQSMQD